MAAQIPPGMDLTENNGPLISRITIAMAILAGLSIVGRLASRRIVKMPLTLSDYLAILGLVGVWAYSGIIVAGCELGIGKHIYAVMAKGPGPLIEILKLIYAGELVYFITLPIIKISILCLYKNLFPGKEMEWAIYGVGGTVILWGLGSLLTAIFSCNPVRGFWDITLVPPPVCIDNRKFFLGQSIPNIVTDFATVVLPIGRVWKLKMSRRSKAAVSAMLALGGFVTIASIIRLVYLLDIDIVDSTYSYTGITIWSAVETNVAVISACLPTMRPLVRKLIPTSFITKYTNSSNSAKKSYMMSGRSSKKQYSHGDEFRRLPEHSHDTGESSVRVYGGKGSQDLEMGDGITVQKGFTTYTIDSDGRRERRDRLDRMDPR